MRRTGSKTFCLASWHGDEVSGGQEPAAAAGFSMLGWLKLEKRGGTPPPRLSAVAIAAPKRRKRRNSAIRLVSIRGFRLTHMIFEPSTQSRIEPVRPPSFHGGVFAGFCFSSDHSPHLQVDMNSRSG